VPGARNVQLPLLPFEKELIELLGCSEAQYRRFAQEVIYKGRTRPAEYDLVPDVQNDLVSVIVSLALGLVFQGVSYLLAPKPKAPPAQREITQRQLESITGADRFSATSGFNSQLSLASFGDAIAIVFGRYTGATGGILAAPSLVWSRSFSLGSQQAIKLLFVVGEQGLGDGIEKPNLNGIFIGSTALDVIYNHDFAFYWKRNTNTTTRIKPENLAYGTRGTASSGDIETNADIFACPTRTSQTDTGFCHTYSLSANSQFGVYSAIPNANNYRVNWKVISIPGNEDKGSVLTAERVKIAGDYGITTSAEDIRKQGQKGVGRNYGRRMGLTEFNGQPASSPTEIKRAAVGDTVTFSILPGELPENTYFLDPAYTNVRVDDINSEITSGRRSADDMLQVGETVMIGRTVWVVESRSLPIWNENQRQEITLRCKELFGSGLGASVGIVSEQMVTRGIYNDDNGTTNARNGLGFNAGAGFYPLLRVAFGVVRNTRACEVTEIGIRSQVWQRANGLCNFAALPTPTDLIRSDGDNINITSGTMTLYLKRTACWTIFLRPAGTDANGNEYPWQPLGEQFCVTGETPQDQFNFIRITHPEKRQYEYRFIPKSGADVARHSANDAVFWRLDAKIGSTLAANYQTAYGLFSVLAVGRLVTASEISFNPELANGAVTTGSSISGSVPSVIYVDSYLPVVSDTTDTGAYAQTVQFQDWLPAGSAQGRSAATTWELFGPPGTLGQTKIVRRSFTVSGNRTIQLEFTGVVNTTFPATHPYFPNETNWSIIAITVVTSSTGFNTNDTLALSIPVTGGNVRATPYGFTSVGLQVLVTQVTTPTQPRGRESAYEQELLGSAQNYAVGTIITTTFAATGSSGGTTVINASGTVIDRPATSQASFPGQTRAWNVTYTIDPLQTAGTWSTNDTIVNTRVVSASNPFYPAGSLVGITLRVQSIQQTVLPATFTAERIFEENSQLNDLSLYNSLIQKSNESSPEHEIVYVNELTSNETTPNYDNTTICGLALKASRNFASIDQVRVWLANGITVKRFHSDQAATGPSNLFCDLVYYLLTDKTAGVGSIIAPELINTADFIRTARFLDSNKLYFDGAISQPTNVRQFIADNASFFLCNFVIANGKFSIVPALPITAAGYLSTDPVAIKQLFTSGNIIEESFSLEFLGSEERKDFQAVVKYRLERRNQLPEEQSISVRWNEPGADLHSVESFDLSQFCTSKDHAFLVARYLMALRRRVTHVVKFKTSPYGIDLAPGDYIKVITQASPYSAANNGVISATGAITSAIELEDGRYSITYWIQADDDIKTATLTVADGKAVEPALWGAVFTISDVTVSSTVYMVEQLTLNEDGLVDVVAVEFPCTSTDNSLICLDILSESNFLVE